MASGGFESSNFDPVLIIAQIGCMQFLFYAVLCPAMLCARGLTAGKFLIGSFSLDDVFLPSRVMEGGAFSAVVAHVVAAAICSIGLVFVVGKAKKCWDFASTISIVHLIIVLCVSRGACGYFWWWAAIIIDGIVCTFLGEYLCMRHELRAIPIRSGKVSSEQVV